MSKRNSSADRFRKQAIAGELEEPVSEARNLAQKLGLEPYPVKYWIIDYDEMNELIAYGGFQSRYPHWRWGMQYDRQQKQGQYGGGKAFEIVNNDNPAHAFLQESNTMADQKAVITHVEAHSDFFAKNEWFGLFTSGRADEEQVNAAAMLERHARAIDDYMSDPDIDRAEVEKWIDHCLSLEDNIDQHAVFERRLEVDGPSEQIDEDLAEKLDELDLSDEIKGEVFDEEWLEKLEAEDEQVTFPEEPQKDILAFVREHGKQYDEESGRAVEMEPWQRDVLDGHLVAVVADEFAALFGLRLAVAPLCHLDVVLVDLLDDGQEVHRPTPELEDPFERLLGLAEVEHDAVVLVAEQQFVRVVVVAVVDRDGRLPEVGKLEQELLLDVLGGVAGDVELPRRLRVLVGEVVVLGDELLREELV